MSPKFLVALTAACIAFAPGAMAQTQTLPGASGTPNAAKTTTVKSSKSNTSDIRGQTGGDTSRMGGGGGAKAGGQTNRMGGGGGKSKPPDSNAINLNSSRSN
jgi:hypothetical protein